MKIWKNKSVIQLLSEESKSDPVEIIKERAKKLVVESIDKGWKGPPYNPLDLARFLKIDISPNDNVIDARTIPIGKNKFLIEYNPFERESRINFSIAHELGHFLFSDCSDEIRNRESKVAYGKGEQWELEFLCNVAASEILLPYGSFIEDANKANLNIHSLIELSNKYKASLEAVMLRFTSVTNKSCGIAFATFRNDSLIVDYSKTSKDFGVNFSKNFVIPFTSEAYSCKYSGRTSSENVRWEILDGRHFRLSYVGLPPLPQQSNQRVGIFFVPLDIESIKESKIKIEFGDAREPLGAGNKIIAQLINTSGGVGFGFGRAMAEAWPETKHSIANWKNDTKNFRLGKTKMFELEKGLFVFQMLAQQGIHAKRGEIPLKYSALRLCLKELAKSALEINASVHMPQIGAGQAGGNWDIIQEMIFSELVLKEIDVTVYILPGKISKPIFKNTLSLFDEESLWQKEN